MPTVEYFPCVRTILHDIRWPTVWIFWPIFSSSSSKNQIAWINVIHSASDLCLIMAWKPKNTDFLPSLPKYNEVIVKTWKHWVETVGRRRAYCLIIAWENYSFLLQTQKKTCLQMLRHYRFLCHCCKHSSCITVKTGVFLQTYLCLGNVSTTSLDQKKKIKKKSIKKEQCRTHFSLLFIIFILILPHLARTVTLRVRWHHR